MTNMNNMTCIDAQSILHILTYYFTYSAYEIQNAILDDIYMQNYLTKNSAGFIFCILVILQYAEYDRDNTYAKYVKRYAKYAK